MGMPPREIAAWGRPPPKNLLLKRYDLTLGKLHFLEALEVGVKLRGVLRLKGRTVYVFFYIRYAIRRGKRRSSCWTRCRDNWTGIKSFIGLLAILRRVEERTIELLRGGQIPPINT